MRNIVFICLFVLLPSFVKAQSNSMTIPYEEVGGKMCVEVLVNGVQKRFIFDTGGQTTISASLSKELGIKATDSIKVTDVTTVTKYYPVTTIENIVFAGNKTRLRGFRALLLEQGNATFDCFDAEGIIGNDIIRNFILEIDSRTKQIILHPKETTVKVSLRNMVKLDQHPGKMPILTIGLAYGETLQVLFDTGSGAMLDLKAEDYERLNGGESLKLIAEGKGGNSMGVAGITQNTVLRKVEMPLVTVGTGKFENIRSIAEQLPYSLLGAQLLKYGKVTIDYNRGRFYFEPFGKAPVDMARKDWNVSLSAMSGQLRVSSLWGKMKEELSVGDEVLKIDGEEIKDIEFCNSIINGLPALRNKEKAVLTIKHQDGTKTITMEKE